MGPGALILATWITFFALFAVAVAAIIARPNRRQRWLVAVGALLVLLTLVLLATTNLDLTPDIAEPGATASAASN
jgi:uncharacterized membrane protein